MNPLMYAALCVLLPTMWGLVVFVVSTRIERAARRGGSKTETYPADYDI